MTQDRRKDVPFSRRTGADLVKFEVDSPDAVLRDSREKALRVSMLMLAGVTGFAVVPSAIESMRDGRIGMAVTFVTVYVTFVILALVPRLPHAAGSGAVLAALGAVSVSEFYHFGLASMGYFCIAMIAVFAQLYLGLRWALTVLFLSTCVVIGFMYAYLDGWIPISEPEQVVALDAANWINTLIGASALILCVLLTIQIIHNRMEKLSQDQHDFVQVLKQSVEERSRVEDELRLNQAQLVHAQKMEAIGQFAAGVAHDFNNLLQGIQGFTELAENTGSVGPEAERYLGESRSAAARASALVRQLLTFSRQDEVVGESVDVASTLSALTPLLRSAVGDQIGLQLKLAEGLPSIWMNRGQFEQIIMNLCINARDAMADGGTLTLSANAVGPASAPRVSIAVSDSGCGIRPDDQARVFEPFFTTKRTGEGIGLGLATVYSIVVGAGGSIECESEVGVGTTFTIELPVHERADAGPEAPAPDRKTVNGNGMTVLLADDEEVVREFAEQVLESANFRVIAVSDGDDAVDRFAEAADEIDFVLLDVMMPGRTGSRVAEAIREVRPETPVIFMTGYADEAAVDWDSDIVLRKPFGMHELLDCISGFLASR